jgi:hypothetical protein
MGCNPLIALAITTESEIQTLAAETEGLIFSFVQKSVTAKPFPEIVIDTEPERGIFVILTEDMRATSKVTLKFPDEDDLRTEAVSNCWRKAPLGNLDNIDESEIHLDSRQAVKPTRAPGDLEESIE